MRGGLPVCVVPKRVPQAQAHRLAQRRRLDDDDLVRARSRIATGAAVASERPAGRMFRLGTLWGYGAEYIPLEAEVDRISAVTLDEIRTCVAEFPLAPTVRIVVAPDPDGVEAGDDDAEAEGDK